MAKKDKAQGASSATIDFSAVEDGGGNFNKRRVTSGDYLATVTSVVDSPAKKDGVDQWLFTLQTKSGGTYPYYCKQVANQLWKVRNLLVAAGIDVPKKKVKVDPNRVVGREVGITLEDDEYNGKEQSNIAGICAASDVVEPDEPIQGDDDKPKKGKKDKKKGKKKDADLESISTKDV